MSTEIRSLMARYPFQGEVLFICLRPEKNQPVQFVDQVQALAAKGLRGDRYKSANGQRQVTLIQYEHLVAIASYLNVEKVDPALTRRNIVVKGLNLLSLKEKKFRVGTSVLEYTGECHPCSRMEENLGPGGYNAMRGHGGITARILETGTIKLGDPVSALV